MDGPARSRPGLDPDGHPAGRSRTRRALRDPNRLERRPRVRSFHLGKTSRTRPRSGFRRRFALQVVTHLSSITKLTVAIPTMNGGRHVAETLTSVLTQDDVAFNLIVCDDRSDDDTRSIVRRVA